MFEATEDALLVTGQVATRLYFEKARSRETGRKEKEQGREEKEQITKEVLILQSVLYWRISCFEILIFIIYFRREEDEEDMVDLSMLMDDNEDVQDSVAGEYLETEAALANALEAGHNITQDEMSTLVSDTCDVSDDSEDAEEECSNLRQAADDLRQNGEDEDVKERAEIIYRIIRMHRAMGNWAQTYIADGNFCDKQEKMMRRISKNRRRMQRKRLAYPTNPLKLKVTMPYIFV